jgi:protein-tyrosine phosphatase
MTSILVVCQGNICRSPMAQGLLAAALPQASVRSAGLGALVGMPADWLAQRLMKERGVDISGHRATQVDLRRCLEAEIVFVMDSDQRRRLEAAYPQARGRVFRLGEYARRDIPDPYRQPEAAFRLALSLIDEGVRDWVQRIQRTSAPT